jgi:hypothetical protein
MEGMLHSSQAHPGLMAASIPWLSSLDYKRLCTWLPYASIVLVLTRDKGSGRVTIGSDGLPRVHYWPDAHDRASMMKVTLALSPGQHGQMCRTSHCASWKRTDAVLSLYLKQDGDKKELQSKQCLQSGSLV